MSWSLRFFFGCLLVSAVYASPPPKHQDSVSSGDGSHDEAYNSIIKSYYTTDPFFGINRDIKKLRSDDAPTRPVPTFSSTIATRRNVEYDKTTSTSSDDSQKRKKVRVLMRKAIPAPLLSHVTSDKSDDVSTQKPVDQTRSKIPAPLLVGGVSAQARPERNVNQMEVIEVTPHSTLKRMHLRQKEEKEKSASTSGAFSELIQHDKKSSNLEEKTQNKNRNTGFYGEAMKGSDDVIGSKTKENVFENSDKFNFQEQESDFFGDVGKESFRPNFFDEPKYEDDKTRTYVNDRQVESYNFEESDSDGFFDDRLPNGEINENQGFFSDAKNEIFKESETRGGFFNDDAFNFVERNSKFPGDDRGDIPTLPEIEAKDGNEPNVATKASQTYFDIMSDFFDEPEINIFPTKKLKTRSSFRPRPLRPGLRRNPGVFPERDQNPAREFSRQPIHTTKIGHSYSEPPQYMNPLDVNHNPADIDFYQGPKYGGHQQPQPFAPAPTLPSHTPRFLDEDFMDIPKIGVQGNFFTTTEPPSNPFEVDFINSGPEKFPQVLPRKNFDSEFDRPAEAQRPFTGFADNVFNQPASSKPEEPFRNSGFDDFGPQFRENIGNERKFPKTRHVQPVSQELKLEEMAPMPYLPPPPEMIEMQRNSLFPVDVPKLGANIPYRPPELIFDEYHKQVSPPRSSKSENLYGPLPGKSLAKKAAPAEEFFAPIRADVRSPFSDFDNSEQQTLRPKKARDVVRSTTPSLFEKFEELQQANFDRNPAEFRSLSGKTEERQTFDKDSAEFRSLAGFDDDFTSFEKARAQFHSSAPLLSTDDDSDFRPTPQQKLRQENLAVTSFEPVRADVRPFEPEHMLFDTQANIKPALFSHNKRENFYRPKTFSEGVPLRRPESFSQGPLTNSPSPKENEISKSKRQSKFIGPEPFEVRAVTNLDAYPTRRTLLNEPNIKNNEIRNFESGFALKSNDVELLNPILDDPATLRPDPLEFHKKVALQFDGSRRSADDHNPFLNPTITEDPFRVTDPPVLFETNIDTMESPIRAETLENDFKSHSYSRNDNSVPQASTERYTVYDPMMFKSSEQSESYHPYPGFNDGSFIQSRSLDVGEDRFENSRGVRNHFAASSRSRRKLDPNVNTFGRPFPNFPSKTLEPEEIADVSQHIEQKNSSQQIYKPRSSSPQRRHMDQVDFNALLAAASASVQGPLSSFEDWSQKVLSKNVDTDAQMLRHRHRKSTIVS